MGEGKPLGACASWTIAFEPVFAAAGREPGAGPTEVPGEATACIRLALRLALVSRFERFEKPSTSVGPAQVARLVRNLSNQGIRSASGSSC